MQYRISHLLDTDVDGFWQLFFDDAFNEALFRHLRFTSYRLLAVERDPDGTIRRRAESLPGFPVPAFARRYLARMPPLLETGVFDPRLRRYTMMLTPAARVEQAHAFTRAEFWAEPRGPRQVERIVAVTNEVRAFGIGPLAERFLAAQTRRLYAAAAVFINRWLAERAL